MFTEMTCSIMYHSVDAIIHTLIQMFVSFLQVMVKHWRDIDQYKHLYCCLPHSLSLVYQESKIL